MSTYALNGLKSFAKSDEGVTAIEYGLLASLIAVVIITAVTLVGTDLTRTFDNVAASFPSGTEDDPNKFPDPCEEDDTNCGNSN